MRGEHFKESGFNSDNESEENDEIARSAHAGMLHDHERHIKYNLALRETLKELEKTKTSIQVLDIGTGTGILSMMAANHSENVKVVTCELFHPIADLAQEIVKDNGFENQIHVLNKSSTELSVPGDLPRKADVLVTEILDSELIGEGMIPTSNDAHQRLLSKDAKVIPSSAQVYIQLIEGETLWNMNNLNEGILGLKLPKQYKSCRRTANAHEIQSSQLYPGHLSILSESCKCTELDFTSVYTHTDGKKQSKHQISVKITKTGKLHGVLMWWDLVLHKEKNIILSMAPSWESNDYVWRDHWMQCIYFLSEPIEVTSGESIQVTMCHDNYTVWFNANKEMQPPYLTNFQPPMCNCNLHVCWSREIFALWNTNEIIEKWKLIGHQLSVLGKRFLIIGDTSLAPIVLTKLGVQNVVYSECSQWSKSIMKEIGEANDMSVPSVTGHLETDVVVYDPFRPCNILPWQILHIWRHVYTLSQANIPVFPTKMYLKAAVVRFQDLYKIRSSVKDILGFDMTRFDRLISKVQCVYSDPDHGDFFCAEPYSMIEYQHSIASDIMTIMDFNLTQQPHDKDTFKSVTINLDSEFTEDMALVVWLDSAYNDDITFTTGLPFKQAFWVGYSKQAVVFIPDHIKVKLDGLKAFDCTVLYRPEQDHEILFSFSSEKKTI